MFVAVHKWKPEEDLIMIKEMKDGFTALLEGRTPSDIVLCSTYTRADHGAFCVWTAPSKRALEDLFKQYLPTMLKGTEFVPVVQAYPATTEYMLSLFGTILSMAPK